MAKVSFIIFGAQKCGTTSLAELLSTHSRISFSKIKEPAFFIRENWRDRLDEYDELFDKDDQKIRGEASTMYSFYPEFPDTPNNIFEYNPKIKLIYIIKDPVKRIESHFAHRQVRGREKTSIDEAIRQNRAYIEISKYHMQIERYLKYFSADQIKVVQFEKLIENFRAEILTLCHFLEIDGREFDNINNLPKTNQSLNHSYLTDRGRMVLNNPIIKIMPYRIRQTLKSMFSESIAQKQKMNNETEAYIRNELKDDLEKLENFSGFDLSKWKKPQQLMPN
ncbi:sulfotransferase domain-containing protein [Hyphobacterium sp. CCMP332]|nr:sulfotransferase domain-containing protein [Hyphobacterium sp. CCMP332]